MKKIIFTFISFLFLSQTAFADVEPAPAASAPQVQHDEHEVVDVTSRLKLLPKKQHEEDKSAPYTIDAAYPQIVGGNLSGAAEQFNKATRAMVEKEVQQFKNYVKADRVHMQTLPEEIRQNSLKIDYDVDVIKPGDQAIISVRFLTEGFQAGRAHPYHRHSVINFDLATGKTLEFAQLFKPKSKYLSIISHYSQAKLNEKLEDKWMINEGTKPVAKNYKNWNLTADSIVITFDEYQVAPYVYGAQEVDVPYEVLKKEVMSTAPVYACVIEPKKCES